MPSRCAVAVFAILFAGLARHSEAQEPNGSGGVKAAPMRKLLFLGNSITLHGPAANIGWNGNWGMAASEAKFDYVHRVTDAVANTTGKRPQTIVANIADFERGYATFDVASKLKAELAFDAEVVIVAIGENTAALTSAEAKQQFAKAFAGLLEQLKKNGNAQLFVRSSFWPDATKDGIMKRACEDAGGTFVDIGNLAKDEANFARAERKIDHSGVAAHPGDRGMQRIADAIWGAMSKRNAGK